MLARILVNEPIDPAGIELLQKEHEVVRRDCSPSELLTVIGEFDALIVRSATDVTADVIAAGRRLQVIGRAGVGVNNIDVEAATARGVVVVNVPDGNTIAAAEHTFALMLAQMRHIPAAVARVKAGGWDRHGFVGRELNGKTLGVVGLGRVGQEVSKRALAFGMRVIGYDPYLPAERAEAMGIRFLPFEEVLSGAEILTVHTPLTKQTRGMIGARELGLLRPGAVVINAARGGIIQEAALLEALRSGHLQGAALDVFEEEPPTDNPLVNMPNVVVTPHLGASTREAQILSAVDVARFVGAVLAGEPVPTAVNLPTLSQGDWEQVKRLLPLGEVLGRLYIQALAAPLGEVEITSGELPGRGSEWVTGAVLKGLLTGVVEDVVNLVNAGTVARQNGINVAFTQRREMGATTVQVRVKASGQAHSLTGAVEPDGDLRVTDFDGLPIEMTPTRYMLVTRHQDRPGLIGGLGTMLGKAGVNIASMLVGRASIRGEAVMVLSVDDPVPEATLAELRALPNVEHVRWVELPEALITNG